MNPADQMAQGMGQDAGQLNPIMALLQLLMGGSQQPQTPQGPQWAKGGEPMTPMAQSGLKGAMMGGMQHPPMK